MKQTPYELARRKANGEPIEIPRAALTTSGSVPEKPDANPTSALRIETTTKLSSGPTPPKPPNAAALQKPPAKKKAALSTVWSNGGSRQAKQNAEFERKHARWRRNQQRRLRKEFEDATRTLARRAG